MAHADETCSGPNQTAATLGDTPFNTQLKMKLLVHERIVKTGFT